MWTLCPRQYLSLMLADASDAARAEESGLIQDRPGTRGDKISQRRPASRPGCPKCRLVLCLECRFAHGRKGAPVGQCVLCENTITAETESEEHLIPNALGGRKKVSGFLCRDCNSRTGDSWDAALAAQLLPLCLLMDISRERGEPPPLKVETTAGERLSIGPNGSPSLSSPEFVATPLPSGGTQYQIKPRTMAEARRIVTDLKRKHP
jgi:hypothetical protein